MRFSLFGLSVEIIKKEKRPIDFPCDGLGKRFELGGCTYRCVKLKRKIAPGNAVFEDDIVAVKFITNKEFYKEQP